MNFRRWSALERGYRAPNAKENYQISRLLGLRKCFVTPPKSTQRLLHNGMYLTTVHRPFYPKRDRLTYIRYRTLWKRHPELVRALEIRVLARPDVGLCEEICHRISCDSSLESLHLLYLLASGAKPALHGPETLGRLPQAVTDDRGKELVGLRPRPCLVLDSSYYFFQVSFRFSSVVRYDVLIWDGKWSTVEINGDGHDPTRDHWKAEALGLPMSYLHESQLVLLAEQLVSMPREIQAS
jgi:hypothetical protein